MAESNEPQTSPKDVPSPPSNEKYKVVLLGNQRVGKTSIIFRLNSDTFNEDYNVNSVIL